MRRRLAKRAMTMMALAGVALLVNGCEAQVWGAPPSADSAQATVSAPQATPSAVPQAPPEPTAGLAGLDPRLRQAMDEAAAAGADVTTMVLDRDTGQSVAHQPDSAFPIASVAKLFIADDLLLQASQGETELSPDDRKALDVMLRSSDDSAAQTFWDRSGGNAVIARIVARYGLTGTTAPWNGHWDVTTSTASDLVRYYDKLLSGSGGLPPEQADVILDNIARFTPTGLDGYPQRFGIPDGLFAEPVAVKQGWFCCWNGGNQLHVSTGVIGADRRYVMVISSLQPVGEAAARATITQAVKTMFPGGKI
ncbi:Beta-lactamase class A [Mycolicibacterium rutilum]|uniref:Beta-lactamase class A n=1 Tax=Mycolicibacterium rutilum TaxID=370526 RepID=A0A1H6M254_MYCRU|nr:serine hydrolase [Mycolicibacterium rutilum]SEH91440.1 Beta-lactamase class A [Mycolicibacterium rutilum]